MIVCQTCREEVSPGDSDVLTAYEQKDVTGMGAESREYMDGLKVCFHRDCFPVANPAYRVAPDEDS